MISTRIKNVQDPVIPIVAAWTQEVPGTISLGQGIVNYAPPDEVLSAVQDAARHPESLHRYGSVVGTPQLLDLIERKLGADNGIRLNQESTAICSAGANMAFLTAILSFADIGDEIILISPYYFNHQMAIEIAGCRPVIVAANEDFQVDIEPLKTAITKRTRAIVTVSPNNPTGAVYSEQSLLAINELCAGKGLYHISDEAYEYFHHNESRHVSPGARINAEAHTISLFSLSKSYGMAGWRIGYSVVPEKLVGGIKKIQDTNLICPPLICQRAAEAALSVGSEWCRKQTAGLTAVRDSTLKALSVLDDRIIITKPEGAFYVFLKLLTSHRDMDLVEQLIRQHRVAVLPGSAFGAKDGCHLRLSYGALAPATVEEGIGRLCRGLSDLLDTHEG